MKAIAILHVDPEVAETALEGVTLTKLDDCVLLPLGVSLASDPAQLAAAVRELAGPLVDLHREARGVPVLPDSYALKATTWDAAVAELGEAADWVKPAPANPMAGLEGLLGAFGGGAMPGGAGMPDMSALADQLQGEQGAALLEQAMQMAQQLAQTGALADLAKAMAPPGGAPEGAPAIDPAAALAQMGADPGAMEGVDLEAMSQQAQAMMQGVDLNQMAAQAKAMLAANPALEQQLTEQLGEMVPKADPEEE